MFGTFEYHRLEDSRMKGCNLFFSEFFSSELEVSEKMARLAFNSLLITSLQIDQGIWKYGMDTFSP